VSAPERTREERERRRAKRRAQIRRRRIGALVVLLVLVGGGVAAAVALTGGASQASDVSQPAPAASGEEEQPAPDGEATAVAAPARPDGSLGARNVRLACTLLTKQEIKAQFGGPVGKPTPIWPYCQWTIGRDAWLSLWVGPKTSIERMRERSYVMEDVGGLGDDAFFGTDRYLYFGQGGVSYYLVYQRVGEYTELRRDQLLALAEIVLSRPLDTQLPPTAGPGRDLLDGPPTPERPLVVYFGGGSLSAGPEWAFVTQTEDKKLVKTYPEYQVGTGIVRSDYFDWRRHLQGVVNARRPDVVIFMAGANDSQDYIIDGVYHPNGSPVWRKRYRRDVSRIMDVLAADGRKVIWVGMPPMQDTDLNDGMVEVNRIVESEAGKRDNVSWVDTWSLFSAPGGGYTSEIDGQTVRLEDGIHLNVEGSELLAAAIIDELEEITGAPELSG
jgi:lysophospholipase L1-like esterase